jgi:hypothetical protein
MVIDAWQKPEPHGRPGLQPRGLVIDLHDCALMRALGYSLSTIAVAS